MLNILIFDASLYAYMYMITAGLTVALLHSIATSLS